jgi:hypothetical protein
VGWPDGGGDLRDDLHAGLQAQAGIAAVKGLMVRGLRALDRWQL